MITEDKITEIFCIVDDFCKFYDALMVKYTFKALKKRNWHYFNIIFIFEFSDFLQQRVQLITTF